MRFERGLRRVGTLSLTAILFVSCNRSEHEPDQSDNIAMARNDVCGFETEIPLGPIGADNMVTIPPAHPDIVYFGRIDCSNRNAPTFAHSGISIRMRFEGDAIDLQLKDFGDSALFNYYNIIIDDRPPFILEVSPKEERYPLARNLAHGPHTVEIFKRGESCPGDRPNAGKAAFLGFRIRAGKTVLPLVPRTRRIEFIGDSITCGYGNEVATMKPEQFPFTPENENAYNAWGAVAARALNAEYMSVAYSGRGISRNWASFPADTLPEMYLKILPDEPESPLWDTTRFRPDLVVINLGTNDYSENAPDIASVKRDFRKQYADFIDTLRAYYPNAAFILTIGPMLSDEYPQGYEAETDITAALTDLIENRRLQGDDRVYLLKVSPQTAPYGEDWHPSAAVHRQMADELLRFIEENGIV